MGTPAAEIEIDVCLVRSLLTSQHSDLAHLPITPANSGWDNAMFRLGETMAVRLPRRQLGADLIQKEQIWLSRLAPQLTLPTPLPIRIGLPDRGYPWCWSVVPWIAGETVDRVTLVRGEGRRFAEFLRSLHKPAPSDAPINPYRGCQLSHRSAQVNKWMIELERSSDPVVPSIQRLWQQACQAPIATSAAWIHGDLHAHNVLAADGKLSGVIDWGDLTSGDVATDLAAIWMLFERPEERMSAIAAYGINRTDMDEATCLRAKGWAIFFAIILLKTGLVGNLSHAAIGRATLRRLIQDS